MPADVLRGRVALVTGPRRGVGRQIAVGLAARGAAVALLARSEHELSEAAMHAGGHLITPEQSARSLLDRIPSPRTGEIWSVGAPSDRTGTLRTTAA